MDWVEITGKTVDEARDRALDELGVDEQDAEIEVLEEPRAGLFGRMRGEARVRARVRPTQARPKVERRDRRRGGGGGRSGNGGGAKESGGGDAPAGEDAEAPKETVGAASPATGGAGGGGGGTSGRRRGRGGGGGSGRTNDETTKGSDMPDLNIDEQADVVAGFLTGLAEAFGIEGTSTASERVEDDTVEVRLEGDKKQLGLLIGKDGATLQLVQELARTVVQRRGGGTQEGRIRIDVGGYRQWRRARLEVFAKQVADEVLSSGKQKALEPMNPADRKVVHDTVNGIDGVRTISEGEEPRRRVVLLPAD